MTNDRPIPILVAHRGLAHDFPENSLIAIEAALNAGACCVEIDVQQCADGTVILLHDDSLKRTGNSDIVVMNHSYHDIKNISVHEPDRFGLRHAPTRIPTLREFVELMLSWPKRTAFIEIKTESLSKFGFLELTQNILKQTDCLLNQRVIISYDAECLKVAKQGGSKIGLILRTYEPKYLRHAENLQPEFLICNKNKLPENNKDLWSGCWQWVIYEITDPLEALKLAKNGIDYIESMNVKSLFSNAHLKNKCGNNDD